MKVYVADLGSDDDPHLVESGVDGLGAERPEESEELESVFYVPVSRRVSNEEIDSRLKEINPQWLRAAEAVVLRLHPPQARELLEDEDLAQALDRRLEGQPILIAHLGTDRSIELTPLREPPARSYDGDELIEALRSAELDSWLRRPGVVFPANHDFHYEGPNGCRYESFMRIGTAIQGSETLDAIAFWLQPYLEGGPIVVLDAWTIASVALSLSPYAERSGLPCQSPVDVECLVAYDEHPDKLAHRLAAIRRALPGEELPPVLLISSVVSMGNLHRRLEETIVGAGFGEPRSLALYGDTGSTGTVFCRPEDIGRYWRHDQECPLDSPVVPISPATYLLEVAIEPEPQRITASDAEPAWEFFKRYAGADVISVHHDDGLRHHLLHIDVEELARHPEFVAQLETEVGKLAAKSFDAVLAPDVPAAAALARLVGDGLGIEPIIASENELSGITVEEKAKLREARRILLVDDVLISGARLMGYRNFLRRGEYVSPENPAELHLLVGVARVDDNTKLRGITDMVHGEKNFHAIEQLLLPNWGKPDCPWCWELRQLEELGGEVPITTGLEQRLKALADRAGLRDSLFIPWVPEAEDPLPVSPWKLTEESVFHAHSQVEMFAAVASAVQSIRATGDLSERHSYPLTQVLDPKCWLTGRFYDSVIAASILRCTRRHDLRATKLDPLLLEGVEKRAAIEDMRGELLMAVGRGHLPLDPDLIATGGILDGPADPGFAGMMRTALEQPGYSSA